MKVSKSFLAVLLILGISFILFTRGDSQPPAQDYRYEVKKIITELEELNKSSSRIESILKDIKRELEKEKKAIKY